MDFYEDQISSYKFGWKKVHVFIGINLITWLYSIDGIHYLRNYEIYFNLIYFLKCCDYLITK
jgi:hypothetical protein